MIAIEIIVNNLLVFSLSFKEAKEVDIFKTYLTVFEMQQNMWKNVY
jgi:hypothetical protein